jgi:PhzF family phenazine biosynthesis protein
MKRPFRQVNVFSSDPLCGNPLAVVHAAEGIGDERMAEFARWTQLSETTYLLPPIDPRADYRLRIFTPGGELAFAGHPTLGSCYAWLAAGGVPRGTGTIIQECGVGLVQVRAAGRRLEFAAPPLRRTGALDAAALGQIVSALQLAPSTCAHTNGWTMAPGGAPSCCLPRRTCWSSGPTGRSWVRSSSA